MSKVPAHYELIPEIKKLRDKIAPQTLLTINGDIRDRQHGLELVQQFGVDGIMIGRGVFSNPFAFEVTPVRVTQGGADQPAGDNEANARHNKAELLDLLQLHLDLFDKYTAELESRRYEPLKRFFKIYIRDFTGASDLRAALMMTSSTPEARDILNKSLISSPR